MGNDLSPSRMLLAHLRNALSGPNAVPFPVLTLEYVQAGYDPTALNVAAQFESDGKSKAVHHVLVSSNDTRRCQHGFQQQVNKFQAAPAHLQRVRWTLPVRAGVQILDLSQTFLASGSNTGSVNAAFSDQVIYCTHQTASVGLVVGRGGECAQVLCEQTFR